MSFLDRITSIPALILAALAVASGAYTRSFELTSPTGVQLTQTKLMLDEVTDTRFLANVVLLAWLVALVIRAPVDAMPDRLIRHGSYRYAILAACRDGMAWALAIVPLLLAAMYVTALGLPFADDGTQGIEGYSAAQQRPGWPWLALVLGTIALATALLLVTQVIALALHIAVPIRGLDIVFAVAVGMLALLSAAGVVDASSPLNLSHLTTAQTVAADPGAAIGSWAAVTIACATLLLAVRAKDRTHRSRPALLGRRRG
ncbi:hypothetical protein [Clavibacter lycopersici]|uniref:Uncharacterized protein n=1 Tax=Clavibacter lycopersici TaxID=2301718 RepID=A0A399TCX3_9MICO|nr:hypothetical protein [Clavibacter lycopersici]RIJ51873.1 hypothetical protein DZG00_07140 [Clavibacter lycopersici]RIJ62023.1 hypothetical protein DZG02_03935 [Clavibacter lycopersici]